VILRKKIEIFFEMFFQESIPGVPKRILSHQGRPKTFSVPSGLPLSRFQGCHGPKMSVNGPNRRFLLKYFKEGVIWGTKILRLDEAHQGRPKNVFGTVRVAA